MSSLNDRLREDMVRAMKAKEKDRVSVIRMLISTVKDEAIKQRGDLDDDAVLKVLMSYAKKREESVAEMIKQGREDLAEKERAELAVVQEYLPQQLTDDELDALVTAVVTELGATSMKDMGRVMKTCQERAAGRAAGGRVSALVKSKLSS